MISWYNMISWYSMISWYNMISWPGIQGFRVWGSRVKP